MLIALLMVTAAVPMMVQATQEIVDSYTMKSDKLKLGVVLWKDIGEIDPNWDYYAVKATVEDIKCKNKGLLSPMCVDMTLKFPNYAEEVPSNHEPRAQWYWLHDSLTFNYIGISYTMNLPAFGVEYDSYVFGERLVCSWKVRGHDGVFAYGYVFSYYTEFAVGVRVPQGKEMYCLAVAWVCWYEFWLIIFHYSSQDSVGVALVKSMPSKIMHHVAEAKITFGYRNYK